jgi:hypothetical protein
MSLDIEFLNRREMVYIIKQLMASRKQLLSLRIAIARTAQSVDYETLDLPVLDRSYEELLDMAENHEHGWKTLLMGALGELKDKGGLVR